MALPKIQHPTFNITLPSTKKKKLFRRFVSGEEKILLMGKESKDGYDIYTAVRQVINNCAADEDFDVDAITPFDFDYIFMKLRAASVNNMIELKYIDPEDDEEYAVSVDLNEVDVVFPEEKVDPIIPIDDKLKIKLRYPTMQIVQDSIEEMKEMGEKVSLGSLTDSLLMRCIDQIIEGEDIYEGSEASRDELEEFFNDIPTNAWANIETFFSKQPQLYHKISYTNSKGTVQEVELRGLQSFFTF